MARPIQQVIDGIFREVDGETPLAQLVPKGTPSIVSQDGQLYSAQQYSQMQAKDIPGGFDTNTASIVQASTLPFARPAMAVPTFSVRPGDTATLMAKEVQLVQRWLQRFAASAAGPRGVQFIPGANLLIVRHFPLPDHCRPDYIDLLIDLNNYPSVAPIGLYLQDAPQYTRMIDQIAAKAHIFNSAPHEGAEQPIPGYRWVCLVCENWQINYADIRLGQTLAKFLGTFYAVV